MMYSKSDLWRIADYYRREDKPAAVTDLSDLTKSPNDNLLSYYITESTLSLPELVQDLKHPTEFNDIFTLYYPKIQSSDLPRIGEGISLGENTWLIAGAIEHNSDLFAQGYDDNKLIIASTKPRHVTYPSGKTIEYHILRNEHVANISIFEGGYSLKSGPHIRQSYITMLIALAEVQKENPEFGQYKDYFDAFSKAVIGIVVSHEVCEWYLVESCNMKPRSLELELEAEAQSREFLTENGMDEKLWQLYHLLRANPDEKDNISRIIVDQIIQPLA